MAILIFEFFIFQFSLEIGAVSLVLIIATFCIGFVIKKITTVVEQPSLVFSSEPFRDSSKYADNKTKSDKEKKYDSALSNSGPIDDDLLLKDLEKFFETNKGNENGPQIE